MESSSNGLAKLLPKAIARRRKGPSSLASTTSSNDDVALQKETSNLSRSTTRSEKTNSMKTIDSQQVLESANEKENANKEVALEGDKTEDLITYDSDPESAPTRPTAFSPHPSQIGYLTTSSPLVQAAHNPEPLPSDSQVFELSTTSSTLPGDSVDSLDSSIPSIVPSETSLAPQHVLSKKSSAGRLRDVFRSSKKGSEQSSSDEKSPKTLVADKSDEPVPSLDLKRAPTAALERTSTGRPRRASRPTKLDPLQVRPPQTPPDGADKTPPVIVNTPPTPTDSAHPEAKSPSRSRRNSNASSPGNMITQRRSRAGSGAIGPSKLSNITSAPLTPTPESGPQPSPGNQAANFFSSMFSAVQNTANNLSNTISNTNLAQQNKSRTSTLKEQSEADQDSVEVESSSDALPDRTSDSKEPAVKTIGMGDLSLSQLGIVETPSNQPTPVTAKFNETESRTRSESAPVEALATGAEPSQEDSQQSRPRSLYDPMLSGDRTPPTGSVYEGKSGIQRSGSIRSAIGRRRKRGSSAATGTSMAIGAAISAATTSIANPVDKASAPKYSGFAVATKKRNRDFHNLFKSVPDDDYLIEDYSCALQREILAHGRLYVSEGHLCFSSNIMGWVTTLVLSFDEIVSVEKRNTALVFKNGLEICTLHNKHTFASLASRDTTYDLIVKIWKMGHPHLQSSLNGVRLEETGGDKTEKIENETESVSAVGSHSISGSDEESDGGDDIYDEDEDQDEDADSAPATDAPALEAPAEKAVARKASGGAPLNLDKSEDSAVPFSAADFPGPTAHTPTECGDTDKHYDKITGDDVVPAPLGKVYNLLFGPASGAWMSKFLTVDQKCTELVMEDKKGLTDETKTRTYNYIKPLGGSIGPKQTKCIVTEVLERMDLEKAVSVLCSTQTPDVPSGNIFVTKTRYCLSWAEGNATRVQMNCTIEWSGKSWLKGPIEKGANDGQAQFGKDLFAALKAAVSSRARVGTTASGAPAVRGGKKRSRKSKALASGPASDVENDISKISSAKQDWGLFEPARPLLGPLVDAVRPILTGNVVYGLLVGLIVATWFGFGSNRGLPPSNPEMALFGAGNYPQRLAAYEEMWRREESELWDWIEERAGLERLTGAGADGRRGGNARSAKGSVEYRTMEEKLREERVDEREIREAIRVTEERLRVLKKVVDESASERR
ncbi:hypothetical protein QBC37DRAFT_411821 [Rhypophila decipiens]|uniref:VASt domain-containing protein n=1 Tax=Rhypophila decipiens TaxID=261697 RepID=A0AAN6YI56_9PEZI|nr:hypothetical protein QBC37DRAFT_411821 [Rhypophila decipiens]